MRKILLTLIVFLTTISNVKAQNINDLILYTEDYPPYNFKVKGKNTGIAVDLLALALKKAGSSLTAKDVILTDWNAGYNAALNNPNTVIFSTTRSDARDPLFKWVGPVAPTRTAIIAKKGTKKITDPKQLKGSKIAVIKGDIGQVLAKSEAGVADKDFLEFSNLNDVVSALESGKAKYWTYEGNVAIWTLKNKGLLDKYEIIGSLGTNDLSYSFNKNIPDEVILKIQDAIDEIKLSGEYQAILEKYSK